MHFYRLSTSALFLIALAFVPTSSRAAQSYDNCTGFIDSLPAVISTQGTWCLRKDVSTALSSGRAIDIQANNVTIDCNDFKVGGLAAGPDTQTNGIDIGARHNATVRHCNIRGFLHGIYAVGGSGNVAEDNRFDGNTFAGITMLSDNSMVRRNLVFDTGGGSKDGGSAIGIQGAFNVDIMDNTISGVVGHSAGGFTVGIFTQSGSGIVSGNRIRDLVADSSSQIKGVLAWGDAGLTIINNQIVGDMGDASKGLDCDTNFYKARAKDNVIFGFSDALSTCSDAGGNDISSGP